MRLIKGNLTLVFCWMLTLGSVSSPFFSKGQVQLTPVVIGSAGTTGNSATMNISWSAGEMAVTTVDNGNVFLTQGFHQPWVSESMYIVVDKQDATCKTSNDGIATVKVFNGIGPYSYFWSGSDSQSDSAFGLSPGNHSVIVRDVYGRSDTADFEILVENDLDCKIHIYSGFTPNADGVNELWEIDGIDYFPDNRVEVYNRWGDEVWSADSYDNISVVFNGTDKNGQILTEGTYFYIVRIDDTQYTGWVEITR